MKKQTLMILTLLLLFSASPALGQASTPAPSLIPTISPVQTRQQLNEQYQQSKDELKQERQEVQNEIRQQAGELRGTITQKREEIQEQKRGVLSELKVNIVTRIHSKIKSDLEKRYQNLQEIKQKIQSRISEKKSAGLDMAGVEAKLATLATYEATYRNHLIDFDALLDDVLDSNNPISLISSLRQSANTIKGDIKQIRQVQIEAVRLMVRVQD
ncbi:MAG: hypothetical protein ACOX6N_02735 [Patescibacteria group bacterium]|jgi:flagellar motility protein MotE (MotC chaperone)